MKATKVQKEPKRRASDLTGGPSEEINVLQSVNAPMSLFQYYKDLAIATYGDSSKRQFFFRKALTEFVENHKEEYDKVVAAWRKTREIQA